MLKLDYFFFIKVRPMLIVEHNRLSYHLILNDPQTRNALGSKMSKCFLTEINKLKTLLKEKNLAKKPRALLIQANSGNDIFSSGGNLHEIKDMKNKALGKKYAESWSKVCKQIESLPIPVIACIDGHVYGGALELIFACDLRISLKNNRFVFRQLEAGLATGFGGCQRLVELIGKNKATQILLFKRKTRR